MVDKQVATLFGDITIHLVEGIQLGSARAGVADGNIHHLKDNLGVRVGFENALYQLIEVVARVLDTGPAFTHGVIDGELNEHGVRLVLQDFLIEAFHSPVRVGTPLGAIDYLGLARVILLQHGGELVNPGADRSEASAEGDDGLLFARIKMLHELSFGLVLSVMVRKELTGYQCEGQGPQRYG